MLDIDTLNRLMAQAVATGRSGVIPTMPNRAGKSMLHRQIKDQLASIKPIKAWDDSAQAQIQSEPVIDEDMRDLAESRLNYWFRASLDGRSNPPQPQGWRECFINRYTRKEIEDMLTPNPIELPKGDG